MIEPPPIPDEPGAATIGAPLPPEHAIVPAIAIAKIRLAILAIFVFSYLIGDIESPRSYKALLSFFCKDFFIEWLRAGLERVLDPQYPGFCRPRGTEFQS